MRKKAIPRSALKENPDNSMSRSPKSKIYCLIHINTGVSRYLREMSPALANQLNHSLHSPNSPLRWITTKEFATRTKPA